MEGETKKESGPEGFFVKKGNTYPDEPDRWGIREENLKKCAISY